MKLSDHIIIFAFDQYYRQGGWNDVVYSGTVKDFRMNAEAIKKQAHEKDFSQVINVATGEHSSFYEIENEAEDD